VVGLKSVVGLAPAIGRASPTWIGQGLAAIAPACVRAAVAPVNDFRAQRVPHGPTAR
jgi:hypothetical protein